MANEIYDSTWWGNTIDTASSIGTSTEMIQGQFNMLTSNQPNLVVNGDFLLLIVIGFLENSAIIDNGSVNIIGVGSRFRQDVLTVGKLYKLQYEVISTNGELF